MHRRREVPCPGKSRYYSPLKFALGIPAASGPQKGWVLAPLRRLPPPECRHHPRKAHLTWWRTRCPARRPPPPGSNGSAQPSPTNRPLTSRTWLSARSSAHRYKLSVPARGCASSPRRSATLTSSATHPRELFARWYPDTFGDRYSNTSTEPPTLAGGQPAASTPPGVYGKASPQTSQPGQKPALTASGPKFTATYRYLLNTSQYPPAVSAISTWTWWGPPLPASKGFTYLFTIIDWTSRWPEAIPIAATTTVDCANALFQGWVSHFGVPAVITSDRGAQFTSSLWAPLCSCSTSSTTRPPPTTRNPTGW